MTPQRFQRLKQALQQRQPDLTVLMDNVHKTHNLSAIIRNCDAVGIHEIHAVSAFAFEPHRTIDSGSRKWVKLQKHQELSAALDSLQQKNMQLLSAHPAPAAADFRDVDYTKPTAIIVGTELYGVSPLALQRCDLLINIPMLGMVDSLNVSVAAALILFEAQRQRQLAGLYQHSRLPRDIFEHTLFEWSHPKLARIYKEKGLAYPPLDENGRVMETDSHRQARLGKLQH